MAKEPGKPDSLVEEEPLKKVCSLLNKHGAKYVVIGGYACILHGYIRATVDVDILVEDPKRISRR